MTRKWKITCNYVGSDYMYAVVRIRDSSHIDHSGNREYATGYMASREEAEKIAEQLNNADGANAQDAPFNRKNKEDKNV